MYPTLYHSLLVAAGLMGYRYFAPRANSALTFTIGELVGVAAAFAAYSTYEASGNTSDLSSAAMKGAELGLVSLVGLSFINMSGVMPSVYRNNSMVIFGANIAAIYVSLRAYDYIKTKV